MIETLKQMNCHYKIITVIINLYQEQLAAVRLESGLTDWFPVKRGVRQGCILFPPIFSMCTTSLHDFVKRITRYLDVSKAHDSYLRCGLPFLPDLSLL